MQPRAVVKSRGPGAEGVERAGPRQDLGALFRRELLLELALADLRKRRSFLVLHGQRVEDHEALAQMLAELPGHVDELKLAFTAQIGYGIAQVDPGPFKADEVQEGLGRLVVGDQVVRDALV